jgi:1-aminocyclopropane-1-carboxylate deaminase
MVNLPSPFSELPRSTLLYSHPSPIEHLKRLSLELAEPDADEATKFWIKREDSNSGLACGGNKIRKLEYVLPDAISKKATVLVSTGGLQSNHMRQVAAAGARYGLKVIFFYPEFGMR